MSERHQLSGSEEGWNAASDPSDSRHGAKQKEIRATIDAMKDAQAKKQAEWESSFGDSLVEATENAVLKGGGNCSGSTAAYRRGWERIFGGENNGSRKHAGHQ